MLLPPLPFEGILDHLSGNAPAVPSGHPPFNGGIQCPATAIQDGNNLLHSHIVEA